MRSPPLLRKMNETRVGDLVVYRSTIYEPLTGCFVARGFADNDSAIAAARQMNEVADWAGIIKTRAEGRRPNCQDELKRIAEAHGGMLSNNAKATGTEVICAEVAARLDRLR